MSNLDYLDKTGPEWGKKQTITLVIALIVLAGIVAIFFLNGGALAEHECNYELTDITYDNVGDQHNECFWYRCSCGNAYMMVGGAYEHEWQLMEQKDTKQNADCHTHHMCYVCSDCGAEKDEQTEVGHTWEYTGAEYKDINYYFQHDRINSYVCTECGETKTETVREDHQQGGTFISIIAGSGACYDKRVCAKCGGVSSEEHTHEKKPGGAVYGPFYLWGHGAEGHTEYYSYECYCTKISGNPSRNLIFEYGEEVLPHTFEHVGWKTYEVLYVGEEIPDSVELVRCTVCDWEGQIAHEHKWETLTSKTENGETVYGGTCACGVTKWFHVHNYVNQMTYENSIYQIYFDVCTICGQKINKSVIYKQDYDRSYKPTTLTPTAPIEAENPADVIEGRFTASEFCYIGRWSAQFTVDCYEYVKYWSCENGITTLELIDAETGAIAFCHAEDLIDLNAAGSKEPADSKAEETDCVSSPASETEELAPTITAASIITKNSKGEDVTPHLHIVGSACLDVYDAVRDGYQEFYCRECKEYIKLKHTHTYDEEGVMDYDKTYHWTGYACNVWCDYVKKVDKTKHTFDLKYEYDAATNTLYEITYCTGCDYVKNTKTYEHDCYTDATRDNYYIGVYGTNVLLCNYAGGYYERYNKNNHIEHVTMRCICGKTFNIDVIEEHYCDGLSYEDGVQRWYCGCGEYEDDPCDHNSRFCTYTLEDVSEYVQRRICDNCGQQVGDYITKD